ncbi:GNAT family N-acetyltransferase [Piscirickettsia salmonis]|nr:GNAT family N-acetyltransferase [Piscirickettsia salmonis]QHS30449.1 GNAT family N-acetyltransferase [Piscirickettsia salmonis]
MTPPELLESSHDTRGFDCGDIALNEWLQKRGLKNQTSDASRVYVITNRHRVIGYYALASGSVERMIVPGSIARNMPETIPVIVLGRLAVDLDYHDQKLGSGLLKDALIRCMLAADTIAAKAVMVHAISDRAKQFYTKNSFVQCPEIEMTLFISIKKIRQLLKNETK